jgi:phosphoribosylanthranilate isomerase
MALKTKVKVGNITNLSDARYCAGMGVDLLGFPITGDRAITLEKFKEINGWITGPELVLEIDSPENASQLIEMFYGNHIEIDASHLPFLENIKNISLLVRVDLKDWKKTSSLLHPFKQYIRYLIVKDYLDASIKVLKEVASDYSVLAEYNPEEGDLDEVLDLPVEGIALKTDEELKPGLKDYQKLSSILEKLELDS